MALPAADSAALRRALRLHTTAFLHISILLPMTHIMACFSTALRGIAIIPSAWFMAGLAF